MTTEHSKYLKSLYTRENPLRALGVEAAYIEREEGVQLVRCNVGDPTGPTLAASNELMAEYYLKRPVGTGYTDHAGEPALRRYIADVITALDRLPEGTLDANKIFCVAGGTGGLNTALSIFKDGDTQVLVSDPFYPPWGPISERNNLQMVRFRLRPEDDFLLNENILKEKLRLIDSNRPVVLMYHYPHNPTGKTLTDEDAKNVARTLNSLTTEFPNLYLVQEDLYLATVRSDMGIYTPMQYLSPDALERTILVHSPSKEGHGQDRGAIVATPSEEISKRLRGSTAFSSLGMSTGALVGTARTLKDIVEGIDPKTNKNSGNHRYVTADYYQERMRAIGQAFLELGKVLNVKILDKGIPEGTYYLWPRLDFLKGKPVPLALQDDVQSADDYMGSYPPTIESAENIKHIFARAHRIGLLPVMITPGNFFTGQSEELRIRIAAVDRNIDQLIEAANTIKGIAASILGLNSNDLGVKTRSLDELKRLFPPRQGTADFTVDIPPPVRPVKTNEPQADDPTL